MSLAKKRQQKQWDQLNDQLQILLKSEIALRQEILGNLNQQEYVLLIGDVELKEQLHQDCKNLAKQLKSFSRERNSLIRKLIALASPMRPSNSLETLLDPTNDHEAETLILYQKLHILVEKTHAQQVRNKTLFELIQKETSLDVNSPSIQTNTVYSNTKPLLITIDYPEKEQGDCDL